MTTLNFIYPDRSDIGFTKMLFPDGQPHLKLDTDSLATLDKKTPVHIYTRIAGSNDLLTILLAKNVLDYLEFEHVVLHITYLMAARMDRVMNNNEPFSLKVVAQLLNSAGFRKVLIFDPHSDVATALVDRAYGVTNHSFVRDAIADYASKHPAGRYLLVSPDAGALKKIHALAHYLNATEVVECFKERDLKTGALSGFKTTAENLHGTTCIIVDDLCDGGGTFTGTATLLHQKGAGKVVLVVSHGIFSKGTALAGIDTIYTTDSYKSVPGVNCFEVGQYIR